jgi:hypothetical protein
MEWLLGELTDQSRQIDVLSIEVVNLIPIGRHMARNKVGIRRLREAC